MLKRLCLAMTLLSTTLAAPPRPGTFPGAPKRSAKVEGTVALDNPPKFHQFIDDAIADGKTAMQTPGWSAAVAAFKDDPNVVFGDVSMRDGIPIREAKDGTPQNPGQGGWPTLRYFNKETGVGGAIVEQNTDQKICDEFKVGSRMIEAVGESMRSCDAASGEGCDEFEASFLEEWRGKDGMDAEVEKLNDLLSEEGQKRMKRQLKLLSKLQAVGSVKEEL